MLGAVFSFCYTSGKPESGQVQPVTDRLSEVNISIAKDSFKLNLKLCSSAKQFVKMSSFSVTVIRHSGGFWPSLASLGLDYLAKIQVLL